jgi:ribosome assembly protein YihI (activator of Der GTPase)
MKLKEKDDLSWCCVSRRHSSDNNSKDVNKQTRKMVPKHRSTEEVPLLVEKVKIIKKKEKEKKKTENTKNIFA